MNVTSTIEQELLEAARSGRDLDEIMRQYGRTKGPFYKALATATATLQSEVSNLSHSLSEAQRNLEALRAEGDSLRLQRDRLQTEIEQAQRDLQDRRRQLADVEPLLDQARELQGLDFTEDHLRQLNELLGRIAAGHGALPPEGIAQFFAVVAQYGEIASWEVAKARAQTQAKQAQAEAKRWQAEARQHEAATKARGSLISIAEHLLNAGVTEGDLQVWESIMHETGSKPEVLLERLKSLGGWEARLQQRSQQVAELEAQRSSLQTQVEALETEREQVSTAIAAVRDGALCEVQQVSASTVKAIKELLALVANYHRLQVEAASLEAEVRLARAIVGEDERFWKYISPPVIQRFLQGIVTWSLVADYNPTLAPPDLVRKGTLLLPYHKVPWRFLIWWAITGLMADTMKLALGKG